MHGVNKPVKPNRRPSDHFENNIRWKKHAIVGSVSLFCAPAHMRWLIRRWNFQSRKMLFHRFCKNCQNYLTNKESKAVYYTVIKHDGHLRAWANVENRSKHSPAARFFYISRLFPNIRSVLSSFALWYRFYARTTIKHAFPTFYSPIKHGLLTNQSVHRVLTIL